jgi:hypothetical protein
MYTWDEIHRELKQYEQMMEAARAKGDLAQLSCLHLAMADFGRGITESATRYAENIRKHVVMELKRKAQEEKTG